MTRLQHLLAFGLLSLAAVQAPVSAHENHQHEQLDENAAKPNAIADGRPQQPAALQEADVESSATSLVQRFFRWVGRMHPFFVHFPIVLFPVAWLMLIVTRRRAHPLEVVRGLIIVAGLAAAVAMTAGWLNAGFVLTDRNPYQLWHRWIGTGLGVAGLALALWAWRRPASVTGRQMEFALGLITLVLLIQGWLGGVVTHGMRHMTF